MHVNFLNWHVIALQRCVGFCCTTMVNQPYVYIYLLALEPPSHAPIPRSPGLSSLHYRAVPTSVLHLVVHTWLPWWFSSKESTCRCRRCKLDPWIKKVLWRRKWCICQCNSLFVPPSPYHCPHMSTSLFSTSVNACQLKKKKLH